MAILPNAVSRPTRQFPLLLVLGIALIAGGCAEPIPGPDPGLTASSSDAGSETPADGMPATGSSATDPGEQPTAGLSPNSTGPDSTGLAAAPSQPGTTEGTTGAAAPAGTGTPAGPGAAERVTADVGVGQRGRSLDKYEGGIERTIVEPARTLFAVRERMVFSTQIPQAMQLYKATHGQGPATEQQFFQEIIQANNIRLPELPAGQRYVYDPASEELLVERPARD
jgi:hypothetical protein